MSEKKLWRITKTEETDAYGWDGRHQKDLNFIEIATVSATEEEIKALIETEENSENIEDPLGEYKYRRFYADELEADMSVEDLKKILDAYWKEGQKEAIKQEDREQIMKEVKSAEYEQMIEDLEEADFWEYQYTMEELEKEGKTYRFERKEGVSL